MDFQRNGKFQKYYIGTNECNINICDIVKYNWFHVNLTNLAVGIMEILVIILFLRKLKWLGWFDGSI